MARYYESEALLKTICRGCNEEFSDAPCEPSACLLLREIKSLPTADVVPKSEVAREIFEEIEKIATAEGAYDYVSIQEIAELEKKYTEQAVENAERCIICGEVIPEGRQACPKCEKTTPK